MIFLYQAVRYDKIFVILVLAIVWIAVVQINNNYLFSWTTLENWIHFIYFPAGIKLIMIMLFGLIGSARVFVGSLYNFQKIFPHLTTLDIVIISVAYAAVPLAVCRLFEVFTGKHYPWMNLRFSDVAYLSVGSSVTSGLVMAILLWLVAHKKLYCSSIFNFIVGDLNGIVLLFIFLCIMLRILFWGRGM